MPRESFARPAGVAILAGLLLAGGVWSLVLAPAVAPSPATSSASQPGSAANSPRGSIGSLPLRDLARTTRPSKVGGREEERERIPVHGTPRRTGRVQAELPVGTIAAPMPGASLSFEGLGEGYTGVDGTMQVTSIPPDTSMAVGPTQIVEVVNTSMAVFAKDGTSLLGPIATNTPFAGFGGLCETTNDGDGVVVYDHAADRWMITWFAVEGADGGATPFLECVAVSRTADATGAWNRYSFAYAHFPDYPKPATWGDSYFVTFNMFSDAATPGAFLDWAGGKVCAYDRAHMLAGTRARAQQCFDTGLDYGGLLVADVDSATPPPAGARAPMVALDYGGLATWRLAIDWATPDASSMTATAIVPVPGFELACGPFASSCITQPDPSALLDSLSDRLMNRLAYRNDGGVERMAVTHSITADSLVGNSGIRWYELGISGVGRDVSMVNQGTYAPTADQRWMGSAARDSAGNLVVGYNVSSEAIQPSIAWAGRLASDPANTLAQTETVVQAGSGSQTYSGSRWGDYSALALDPIDECTFWFAGEYYQATSEHSWHTRIASFTFPQCETPPPLATLAPSIATPTAATTIPFAIHFSVASTGLDAVDLARTGTAVGCTIGTPAGAGTNWTVDVTGCGEGTLGLQLGADAVTSTDGIPGPVNVTGSPTILLDRTPPAVSAPWVTLRSGTTLPSASTTSAVPVTISWARMDAGGTPISRYVVRRSTNGGGTWQVVAASVTGTSLATTMPVGDTVIFCVSGVDAATNAGTCTAGRTLTPRLVQQGSASVHYRGTGARPPPRACRAVLPATRRRGVRAPRTRSPAGRSRWS